MPGLLVRADLQVFGMYFGRGPNELTRRQSARQIGTQRMWFAMQMNAAVEHVDVMAMYYSLHRCRARDVLQELAMDATPRRCGHRLRSPYFAFPRNAWPLCYLTLIDDALKVSQARRVMRDGVFVSV